MELRFDTSAGLKVDLQKLLTHKLAIQGNSGSGKSWLLRTLMEGTHGRVQHLIIDPEGEFRTLRQVFDDYIILASAGGDLDIRPEGAQRPVAELVKAGANIILDLSDFGDAGRDEVCAGALRAVMKLERRDWRHLLVIVDEAQTLAPEGGRQGQALAALTDLALRGRKRGFGLVVATQRLALLNKSLLAMCSNRLVGLTTLGNDVKRAAEELGFNTRERQDLKRLNPGEWFAFGPAIAQEVQQVRSAAVRSTHPEPGQLVPPTPPASAELAAVIEDLRAGNPQEQDAAPSAGVVGPSEAEVARRIGAAVVEATAPLKEKLGRYEAFVQQLLEQAARLGYEGVGSANMDDSPLAPTPDAAQLEGLQKTPARVPARAEAPNPVIPEPVVSPDLPAPQRRILSALAELEALGVTSQDRKTVAVLSSQSPKSSAYSRHISELFAEGFLLYPGDGQLGLSDTGRQHAPRVSGPVTLHELHERWLDYLSAYEADLLRPLLSHYPQSLSRAELAQLAKRSLTSSAFGAALASLAKLGLVLYPGDGLVQASARLFPEGL